MRKIVTVGAVVAALLLAGCAKGATIKPTIGQASPFCNDVVTFTNQAAALTDAGGETRTNLLQLLPPIHTMLVKLQGEAPTADTVNGKSLKTDLGTVATVYADAITALTNASATDPAAVTNALAAVEAKQGQGLTDAVNRLDSYASSVCKVSTASPSVPTSTSAPAASPTTSVAPIAPAAPSTSTSIP